MRPTATPPTDPHFAGGNARAPAREPQDNTFGNSEAFRRFTTLNGAMKHTALPLLFVLLSAVSFFGRIDSHEDTAHAVRGVLLLRDSLREPHSFQVSHALITDKGVCIEYVSRSTSGEMSTGFAVYNAEKDLVWIDNSWVWEQACLFGKYAQRRDGKDVTEAVDAALKRLQSPAITPQQVAAGAQPMEAAAAATTRAIQPARPAPPVGTPALTAPAPAVVPAPVAMAAAQVVAPAPPVETAAPTAQVLVSVVGSAPPIAASGVRPTSASVAPLTRETRLTFPVRSELKKSLEAIAAKESRSVDQVCELILQNAVVAYQKDGTKSLHRLIASQKSRGD